jgi:phosphoribosyl-ATP pyrophosphohydrolase
VKRSGWVAVAAAAVFVVVLVARMPASWVIPTSGANALCASVDGSLWSGSCTAMSIAHNPLGDVSWELHPLRLFLGQLAVHATAVHGTAQASADVELSFGQRITARKLVGDLPLDPAIIPGLPATLRGQAHFDLPLARLEHGIVTQLQGRIEVHDLEDRTGAATALGSYVIEFPAASGGEPSYTRKLLDKGPEHCAKKLGEEAVETVIAAVENDRDHLIAESADLLFHLLVLLKSRGITLGDVEAALAQRSAMSGLEEKAARKRD